MSGAKAAKFAEIWQSWVRWRSRTRALDEAALRPQWRLKVFAYPVKLKQDTNGSLLVTFPDIPEAATSAHNEKKASVLALEALESALEFYFDDGRPVPMPRVPKRGQQSVTLPASMSAKVLLLNEMLAQNVRPADLARLLGTTPQAVNRLTNLRHSTKIDGLVEAFQALGKKLELRVA